MNDQPSELRVIDLRIFATIGFALLAALVIGSGLVFGYGMREWRRFVACQNRSLKDPGCEPGKAWAVFQDVADASSTSVQEWQDEEKSIEMNPSPTSTNVLGGQGSACGGRDRLPCLPGLVCMKATGQDMGTCVPTALMQEKTAQP